MSILASSTQNTILHKRQNQIWLEFEAPGRYYSHDIHLQSKWHLFQRILHDIAIIICHAIFVIVYLRMLVGTGSIQLPWWKVSVWVEVSILILELQGQFPPPCINEPYFCTDSTNTETAPHFFLQPLVFPDSRLLDVCFQHKTLAR